MVSGGKADCGRIRKETSESGRLWGAGKTVRRKMNGVGGKRTVDRSAEKRAKMRGHWAQGGGKKVDGWRQGGARTADGSADKRAKMRGVATQWAPEGNEWRIQTHQAYGASRADTGRPYADAIRRTHIFFLLMGAGSSARCLHGIHGPDDIRATDGDNPCIRSLQVSSKIIVDLIIRPVFQPPKGSTAGISKRNTDNQKFNSLGITGKGKIREGKITHQYCVCLFQQTFDLSSSMLREGYKNAAYIGSKAGFFDVGVGPPNLCRIRENCIASSADSFRGAPLWKGNGTLGGEPKCQVPLTISNQ